MNEINVMHKDRIYNSTHTHFICFVWPAPSSLCPWQTEPVSHTHLPLPRSELQTLFSQIWLFLPILS